MTPHIALIIVLALPLAAGAQARPQMTPEERAAQAKQRYEAALATPRPIAAHDTVWLEELTYLEARDAIKGGKTTALVFAGSTEQNGPYLPGAKHQIALRLVAEPIARKLGNALIAPIIPLEAGNPDNPYMNWGSLYLTRDTFQAVLRDVATSLKSQGFTHIILMGDSGGDVAGLRAVAQELSAKWAGTPAIHHVPEFYNWGTPGGVRDFITRNGIDEKFDSDGIHDEYAITAVMMLADPKHVRLDERIAAGKATINGVDILPKEKTIEMGRKIIEFRADNAVAAIRKVVGQ
ncbi:MAG TPA: creatininase family protein [Vicinamibacterales bacterium]|nr:creatininase family protein [Vicinamibacterales bacterium]